MVRTMYDLRAVQAPQADRKGPRRAWSSSAWQSSDAVPASSEDPRLLDWWSAGVVVLASCRSDRLNERAPQVSAASINSMFNGG
jgi:hypothetical protein